MLRRSPLKRVAPNILHSIGGKVMNNENPYHAAVRELAEEAGIKAKNIKLKALVHEITNTKNPLYDCPWQIFYFTGEYASGEIYPTDEGELIWMSKEEIVKENLFPSTKKLITYILDPTKPLVFATFHYDNEDQIDAEDIIISEE